MLIKKLTLKNFLSYGPNAQPIELQNLNVIIGPNGSGKSNLLEALALLQSTPGTLITPIREGGGVRDWLWKGSNNTPIASIETIIEGPPSAKLPLRYRFNFTETGKRFEIVDECIEYSEPLPNFLEPYFFYQYQNGHPVLNVLVKDEKEPRLRTLKREDINPEASILSQRRDPDTYPELSYLGDVLGKIRIYRDWVFGRFMPPRLPQPTDLPNQWLEENGRNLGLVLNRLQLNTDVRKRLLEYVKALYENVNDFLVSVEGGTVQLFIQEDRFSIPATRLSDGTIRYLCLMAILLNPDPPPLICIDEPELGFHPDLLNNLAEAMKYAAARTQLIVTTHSVELVDAFSNNPEAIIVCEKHDGSSILKRLDPNELQPWLKESMLGSLWSQGQIGGNRW